MFWLILQLIILVTLLYYYINSKYSYWSSRNVRGPFSIFPFGNLLSRVRVQPQVIELEYMKKYGKVYGSYSGLLPVLSIIDAEDIKQVLIKDFQHFADRRVLNTYNTVFNRNLFQVEGEDWKRIRSIVSPAFTSGKLKGMYGIMNIAIEKLMSYMEERTKRGGLVNTKKVISGFTIDIIASTGFATETNANDDRAKESPFVKNGLNLFNFNPLKIASILALPRPILDFLGFTVPFPEDSINFFINLTRQIVLERKKNNVKRNDLIQLMIDTYALEFDGDKDDYSHLMAVMDEKETLTEQKQHSTKMKKTLDETEIISQAVLFFIAGFETTASVLTTIFFEFAHNKEIQERLFEEVLTIAKNTDTSNLDEYFDQLLKNAPYLNAVVSEAIRKYPPVVRLERRVGSDGIKVAGIPVDKGVLIEIPTYAVHHNPEVYPNPEVFNPDRFMPENKHLLVPYTYIGFGDGPRNCIGMRFALQEIKLCLGQIVQKYQFCKAPDTPKTLSFKKGSPMLNTLPFFVKISKR